MILSICIPTLNRASHLKKNLDLLKDLIIKNDWIDDIEIVVSNNNSDDNTGLVINNFKSENENKLNLSFWHQSERLIMQESLLFVVEKAKSKFFMWLGDDDYLNEGYIGSCLTALKEKNVGCIIPSYKFINSDGDEIGGGRDLRLKNNLKKGSFLSCYRNSWRGHQLSGLVTQTEVLKYYRESKVDNIYPCIYFSCLGSLKYDTLHLTESPIKVTLVDQSKKAWGYGEDGLFNDIFDNYIKLPLSSPLKGILQLHFFYVQYWRLWEYKKLGLGKFFKAAIKIMNLPNATFLFKIFAPFAILIRLIQVPLKNGVKTILKKLGVFK